MTAPDPVHPDDRLRVSGSPVEREVGEKVFVLTPDSRMHVLDNESAVFLWKRIREAGDAGVSIRELASALSATFKVGAARAEEDVRVFAGDLLAAGVVERLD